MKLSAAPDPRRLEGDLRFVAHRGDDEPLIERLNDGSITLLSDVEVHGNGAPTRELKAGGGPDTNAHRLEMIQALRDGKHLEIVIKRALAYRQVAGKRNHRGLRFSAEALANGASSWKGRPFLVDHNTYEQEARKGTILTAEHGTDAKGAAAIFMGFSLVKPDAVISYLDGTLDRFSIGWFSTGPVLCTVHGSDVTSSESCRCWPLDAVEIDGKTQIVQYEYQSIRGKELSAVNVPAVDGTHIEDYRAALSAELHLHPTRIKEQKMALIRLAAVLGLAALTDADEPAAVTAAEGLRARALSAETDAGIARTENTRLTADVTRLTTELAAAKAIAAVAGETALSQVISDAYTAGKLGYGKDEKGANTPDALESMLRDFGKAAGVDALKAKITAMRVAIPVGQRQLTADITEPKRLTGPVSALEGVDDSQIAATCAQLGITVEQFRANAARIGV